MTDPRYVVLDTQAEDGVSEIITGESLAEVIGQLQARRADPARVTDAEPGSPVQCRACSLRFVATESGHCPNNNCPSRHA